MRIISGTLGGRNFDSPKGHRTHPMSDKARGALFSTLGDLEGLRVLDAFGGSGALSFEAVSRGATAVICIESDRAAQRAIAQNIKSLGLRDQVQLIAATTNAWLSTNPDALFDIVLCDPPYDDLQLFLLQKLAERVRPGGLLVLSWPGKQEPPELGTLRQIKCKNYGDISLAFLGNPA